MSAGTHTPGPWRLHEVDDTRVMGADGSWVADMGGDYDDALDWPRMEANARLIAAAPDMLAAMKAICSDFAQQHPLIIDGLAAIAKAEGRS